MVNKTNGFFNFILQNDNYTQPLPLTFRQSKSQPTIYGGIVTLLHFFVVISWISFTALQLTTPNWTISTFTQGNIDDTGTTPVYHLHNLIPTLRMESLDPRHLPEKDLTKYFSVYFSQGSLNETEVPHVHYRGEFCTDEGLAKASVITEGFYCPDYTKWDNITLQGSKDGPQSYLMLWVAPCAAAEELFGSSDVECATYNESMEVLRYLQLYTVQFAMLPNGNYVMGKTDKQSFDLTPSIINFPDQNIIQMTTQIKPSEVSFATNWFWAGIQSSTETFYQIDQTTSTSLADDLIIEYIFKGAFYNNLMYLSLTTGVTTWQRVDVIADIANFGGIMSLITLVFSNGLGNVINFQQDLDLSRILYTITKDPKKNQGNQIHPFNEQIITDLNKQRGASVKENNKIHLRKREPFDYPLRSQFFDCFKSYFCCCCCCFQCCKQSKANERFVKARNLLYCESDYIGIIKQLRLSSFMAAKYLKPHHLALMRWFDEFSLTKKYSDEEDGSDVSADDLQAAYDERKVENAELTEKTDRELLIEERLKAARDKLPDFSRNDKLQYSQWLLEQKEIQKWVSISDHFTPQADSLDYLALHRVIGKKLSYTEEDLPQLTEEFKEILETNIENLTEKSSKYTFLKKHGIHKEILARYSEMPNRSSKSRASNYVYALMQNDKVFTNNIQDDRTKD